MASEPNTVDWLTLIAASAGTLLSAGIAVWAAVRRDREAFDLHIDWDWFGNGPYAELPFVYIQNRSGHTISIVELTWYYGALRRKPWRNTAKFAEGPEDVNFPYSIEPGSQSKFYLNEDGAVAAFEKVAKTADRFGFIRRPSLWLLVKTMRGKKKFVAAERALPWDQRPSWLTGVKDDA